MNLAEAVSPSLTVGLLSILWLVVNTQRLTAAAFVGASSIMADFGITAGLAGLLAAAYFPAYGLLQVPMGLLLDRGHPRTVLLWAVTLIGASNLLFALAPSIEWAIAARVGVGLSSAPVFLCCLKICSELSLAQYPKRVGMLVTAGSLGAISSLSLLPLLLAMLPWRTVALLLAAELVLLLPLLAFAPLPRPTTASRQSVAELLGGLRAEVGRPAIWWLALPAMMWCGAYFGVLGWLPRYARDVLRTDVALVGLLPGLLQVGLLVGGTLVGSLQARRRALGPWLFFGGGTVFVVCVAALPTLDGLGAAWLLYLLAPALGLLFATFFTWLGLIGELVPRHRIGTVTGLINGLTFLPSFLDPWLMGAILDLVDRPQSPDPTYSAAAYSMGFAFLAVSMALGLLAGALCGRGRPRPLPASAPLEAG